MDDALRIERFAGQAGRTGVAAASALGAGKGVQQILPGETVYLLNAKCIADGKILARQGIGLLQSAEETVGYGGQDVHMLAVRQIAHEGQQGKGMRPPADFVHLPRIGWHDKRGKPAGNRHPGLCQGKSAGLHANNFGGVDTEIGQHQGTNQRQDEKRLQRSGFGIRWRHDPAYRSNDHGQQGHERYDVQYQQQWQQDAVRKFGQADGREYPMQQKLAVGDQQYDERPEDDEVIDTERFGQHPFLAEGVQQHLADTGADIVEAVLGPAERQQIEPAPAAPDKDTQ